MPYGRTRPRRPGRAAGRAATKRLALEPGRRRVPDTSPASLSGDTCAQLQTMLRANQAADDRHQTRGRPRPGTALLHGLVSGGAGGPKRVGQDKGGPASLCHDWRQQYRVPVWQDVPADPVDARGVAAFCEALSPVALDLETQARAAPGQQAVRREEARQQPRER